MNLIRHIFPLLCCLTFVPAHSVAQNSVAAATKTPIQNSATQIDARSKSPATNSDVLQETLKLLPKFSKSETAHYVIVSNTSPDDITMVGTLLETTFLKYFEVCGALGWNPLPLRYKLVAVVFREQRDYLEFAEKNDKVTKTWAVGYYSPFADRLVFFKADGAEDVQKVTQQLNQQDRQVQQAEKLQQAGGKALKSNSEITQAKKQLAAEHGRIKDLAAGSFVSTAVHEAAHQLFFHTDIQRKGASYPLWLAEGLATNFETERTDTAFGYKVDNWRRRDAFKLATDKNTLIPLEILLTKDRFLEAADSADAITDFYAQSYVLTNWLLRERPTELRLYLESLSNGSFASQDDRQKNFEAIFGPLPRFERNWVRYEGRRQIEFLSSAFCKRVLVKKNDAVQANPMTGNSTISPITGNTPTDKSSMPVTKDASTSSTTPATTPPHVPH